jgi:hypothetical protein
LFSSNAIDIFGKLGVETQVNVVGKE